MKSEHSPDRLLEHFRAPKRHLPLHPLEKAVLAAVAIHLCFLPWALGTMHPWSQITSLVLASIGMILALIPRTYSGDYLPGIQLGAGSHELGASPNNRGAGAFRLNPWPRLFHFPIFWLGLALLGYIALQASNPSWVWERNETQWWLRRVNDIPWLPTSIDTPWERFNIWRQFIIYASAWLTACTVWTGFTRRHALGILLVTLVANGAILGLAGLYLRATATLDTVFWLWQRVPHATAFASFYYRNHAGAYLGLLAVLSVALAAWHLESGRRQLKKSTPASLYIVAVIFFFFCVVATYARGALFALTGALAMIAVYAGIRLVPPRSSLGANPAITAMLTLFVGGMLAFVVWQVDFDRMTRRIESFAALQDREASVHQRLLTYDAAYVMLKEQGGRGVGAGGFRFLFPEYLKRHPTLYRDGRFFWEHAHNDWLEIPIELGVAGCVVIFLVGAYLVVALLRRGVLSRSLPAILVLGGLQTLVHAWIDFPFQNPAILLTWGTLIITSMRWAELEAPS